MILHRKVAVLSLRYSCINLFHLCVSMQNAPLLIGNLVLGAVFSHTCLTVGILLNIYSVTDCTHYIMTVSRQCTFVFQWSLWEHVALQTMTMTPYICKVKHPTCDSACL